MAGFQQSLSCRFRPTKMAIARQPQGAGPRVDPTLARSAGRDQATLILIERIRRGFCLRCCRFPGEFTFLLHLRNPPVTILPQNPFQRTLTAGFLVFFALSCINPPYMDFLLMQHVPTILVVGLLCWLANQFEISRLSFSLMILFLCLHTLGARYLYSFTPYDAWSEALFGINITQTFGFERNHYDRVVHFSYGLLLAIPVQELERRYLKLSLMVSAVLAVEFILATSAAYELLEWMIAVIFTPTWAESFLGQQGDMFDAQKDTALATLGACLSVSAVVLLNRRAS